MIINKIKDGENNNKNNKFKIIINKHKNILMMKTIIKNIIIFFNDD